MKKIILAITLLVTAISYTQNIPLDQNQLKDSTSISKYMPEVAKLVIAKYKEDNKSTYLDNLFRLKIVAKQYEEVTPLLNDLAKEEYKSDLTKIPALGYAYNIFSAITIQKQTSEASFETLFLQKMKLDFLSFDNQNQSWVESIFSNSASQFQKNFTNLLEEYKGVNEIPIEKAVKFCRTYCIYITYSKTSPLGNTVIQQIDKEKYFIDENILIQLPDGNTIAGTLVRLKANTEPQPIIMKYSIYPGSEVANGKEIAKNGFTAFIANTRGKRISESALYPFEFDADDAYHIIDWVSKQSWCNGKIGMYGGSYLGFSQWSALKKPHPALKTIVPMVAVGIGIDYPMQNGVFMSYALQWIHYVMNNKMTDEQEFGDTKKWNDLFTKYYKEGHAFKDLDKLDNRPNTIFQRWLSHPNYDTYWKNMTPQKEAFSNINIPILTITGYYDDDQIGALHYYRELAKWNQNNNSYLIIGPYDHFGSQGFPRAELNGYTIDDVAKIPINDIVFEWFHHILNDKKRPELIKDKVNFEIMGKNEWKHVESLEKMSNSTLTFHLVNENGNNKLTLTQPKVKSIIKQTVDLKDRTECRVYEQTDLNGIKKVIDSTFSPAKHLLVFESDPIVNPIVISGMITANLKIKSNKKDMDIALQLIEKTENGNYFTLNSNLQRASFDKNNNQRKLLKPNSQQTVVMNQNYLTCKQLEKGSKIIIAIGINKDPNWQINYGTGKDVSTETIEDAKEPFIIEWSSDSSITIPVLK